MLILTVATNVGGKLAYAPRGPVCDVTDVKKVKELFDEAEKHLNMEELIMLRCDPEIEYKKELATKYEEVGFKVRTLNSPKTIQPSLNMVLSLEEKSEEEMLQSLPSRTRYKIRKAVKNGVCCKWFNSIEALEHFYNVHEIMAKRQGISYRPKEYFEDLVTAFGKEHVRIYLTYDEEEVLSGAITLNYGDRVWYVYGGSTNNKRNLMPTYLMQWEMIKWGIETKQKFYDFGGIYEATNEDGLYYFKSRFVSEPIQYIGEIDRVYDLEKYQKFNEKN